MRIFHSLVPGSHCSVLVLPEVYRFMDFSGRRLLVCLPYSVLLGSTVDTRLASVYEAFGRISRSCVGLWEMTSGLSPYSALSLVRQRLPAVRQSTWLPERISHFSWFPGDDFMLSPYSVLRWVRQRIHALRQSMEFVVCFYLGDDFMFISVFSVELASSADTCSASAYRAFGMVAVSALCLVQRGYKFLRPTTEAGLLFFPLVRPKMRCIMAGMDRRTVARGCCHHPCRGAEADSHGPLTMGITQLQFD